MAISKDRKAQLLDEVKTLLTGSKLTVAAEYPGTSVKALQKLRADARQNGTSVKVVKNRIFKKAAEANQNFQDTDLESLRGQLIYAFSDSDEVGPAKDLANFAKSEPQIKFVVGFTSDGQLLLPEDLQALASLPTKDQLRAQLVGTVGAPLSGFSAVLAGNVRGVLNVLNARAESIN